MSYSYTNSTLLSPDFIPPFYISTNGEWSAIPIHNSYVVIFKGEQLCVKKTLELSIKYINSQLKPIKQKCTKILLPSFQKK